MDAGRARLARKRRWAPDYREINEEQPRLTLRALKAARREQWKAEMAELTRAIAAEPPWDGNFRVTRRFRPPAAALAAEDEIAKGRRRRRDPDDMFTVAILETASRRWRGMRGRSTMEQQVRKAVDILRELGHTSPKSVTGADLAYMCDATVSRGCAPGTAAFRLSCLSAIGVKIPDDFHFKVPKLPKWFLRPEDEARVPLVPGLAPVALHFIQWTVATGLRVEETLRVQANYVSSAIIRVDGTPRELYILNVPGTKTAGAQATIVLSDEAVEVLRRAGWPALRPTALVFDMPYKELRLEWLKVREFLGVSDVPTATLKALRRSYARRATLKGMPMDVLRQYLRHADIKTTEGYLKLVGGV
jgi:integrase